MLIDIIELFAKTVGLPLIVVAAVWWYMKRGK